MNSTPIQPSRETLHLLPVNICKSPDPFEVADTYTEKAIVSTLLAAKYVNYLNPLFWPFLAAGCGGSGTQESIRGCTKDTDCREPRICKEGGCVRPMPAMDAGSTPTQNPCEEIDCGGHGQCVFTTEGAARCFCDEGYKESEENSLACVMEARSQCLDERTASMPLQNGEYYTVECGPGSHCEEGACRTIPGQQDPNCVTSLKSSSCWVTDVFDIVEDTNERFQFEIGCNAYCGGGGGCADDSGALVGGVISVNAANHLIWGSSNAWLAATLFIQPPPRASYYKLDAKLFCTRYSARTVKLVGRQYVNGHLYDVNEFTRSNCTDRNDVSFRIFFGDDQTEIYEINNQFESCLFQPVGIFSTAGITTSNVRVNLRDVVPNATTPDVVRGSDYYLHSNTAIYFTKLRLWSCKCD